MRDSLRRRLQMLDRTLAVFDSRPALWQHSTSLVSTVALVRDGADDIRTARDAQDAANPTGLTKDKRDARDLAEDRLAQLGEAASLHADDTGDDDFRAATVVPHSEWDALADDDFFASADTALDRIEATLGPLAEYEVTGKEVADARDAVDAARPLGAARDLRAVGRRSATDALDGGYSAVVPTLKRLDSLVLRLIRDAAFRADYAAARRIPGV